MKKTFAVIALAGATVASSMIVTAGQAEARRGWGPAIGFGIAGAFIASAAIAASESAYVEAPVCRWVKVEKYDDEGNYIGVRRVQVCDTTPY